MKVVNIISGKDLGGPKQSFVDYGKMLTKLGYDVHYVLRPGAKCLMMLDFVDRKNIHIVNYYRSDIGIIKKYSVNKLKCLLKKIEPEVIVAHKQFDLMLLKMAYPSAYLIGVVHGFNASKTEYADQLIAVSAAVTKWLQQHTPTPCQTIANTVEVEDKLLVKQAASRQVVIGTMAVFRRKKQLDHLIKVAARLKDLNCKIIIAGRGFRGLWYKVLLSVYGVADVVEIRSWVRDKKAFFSQLDIYCVTSKTESFNISLIEAMAHSVCVVSSSCGGPCDIIDHRKTGMLFAPGNIDELEEVLRELILDSTLRWSLIECGFEKANSRFSLPVITQQLAMLVASRNAKAKIAIFAGEVSGDMHAAQLARSLGEFSLFGMGGERMLGAGVNVVYGIDKFKIMGFLHILLALPAIIKRFFLIKRHLTIVRPSLVILVDYPGFNMRIAKLAKRLDLQVLYYIAPKLWATREGRAKALVRDVDYLAVIFPFEVDYFKKFGVKVGYVGNPLLSLENGVKVAGKKQIALLPGSRQSEVDYLMPELLLAAALLSASMPDFRVVLVKAVGVSFSKFRLDGIVVSTNSIATMRESAVVVLASGTATLEAAMLHRPMVVVYKTGWLNYQLAKILLRCKYVSLPNILANKSIVSELLQASCVAEKIEQEVIKLLSDDVYYAKVQQQLIALVQSLQDTQASDLLQEIKKMLGQKNLTLAP